MRLSLLLIALSLLGCMKAQRPKKPQLKAPQPAAPLQFTALVTSAKDKTRLELSADSLLYADAAVPLLHVTRHGISSLYNPSDKSWGPENVLEESSAFQQIYHLPGRGWIGLAADWGKNLNLVDGKLTSFTLPALPAPFSVLGVGYDFIAYYQGAVLNTLEVKDGQATLHVWPMAPANLRSLQRCISGCIYWGFDGQNLQAMQADGLFQTLDVPLEIPSGKDLVRLVGAVALDAGGHASVSGLYGLSRDVEIYAAQVSSGAREADWDNALQVIRASCLDCHVSDGFDQEAVMAALKKDALLRLRAGTMPPPSSRYAQSFTAGDAALLISWLSQQADTGPDQPTDPKPTPTPDPNAPISGELKKLADTYCFACHSDNQKQQWWLMRKASVKERVESGDMPRGREMPAADRKRLVDLVQAL